MSSSRTTLRLDDKRKMLLEKASRIVAEDDHDDPPMSDVIDAALTHLIESHQNLEYAREEHPPNVCPGLSEHVGDGVEVPDEDREAVEIGMNSYSHGMLLYEIRINTEARVEMVSSGVSFLARYVNRLVMDFLVYSTEAMSEDAPLDSFEPGADEDLLRIVHQLELMDLSRVLRNQTVDLLVDDIDYNRDLGTVTADIYKHTNPRKAIHQLTDTDEGMTIQEIISEHDDAFLQGSMGMKKCDGEIRLIVENTFGSYFSGATIGMQVTPLYSSDSIRSIQASETIGRTTLDFADEYDLTASLFKPPDDGDVRKDEGFGKVDLLNSMAELLNISRAHRVSLDINRDEWLANVQIFHELIESGIVTTVRVEDTTQNTVVLGEGGDRAVREKVSTVNSGRRSVQEALMNLSE